MDAHTDTTRTRRPRPAVMSDVARLAGVSHQTVSRVINQSQHVRDETRERVLAAMRELGYRPNPVARALVTGRSNTLGVISFDTTLYGPASTLVGIERAAHDAGYFMIVASLKALTLASLSEAIARLSQQGVDGLIVIAPYVEGAEALLLAPSDIPLVAAEAGPDAQVPLVAIDQRAGARAATQHLLDLGHRTVWHVAGPENFLESQQRVAGWRATLAEAGAAITEPLHGDWSARSGYELGLRLSRDPSVTAIFVANDQMSLGVLRAMHERGRDIPGAVSIVGFDDIPESPFFTPPLTTIRQDFDELGRMSLKVLLAMIGSESMVPVIPVSQPRLIVRASTGPAPGAGSH